MSSGNLEVRDLIRCGRISFSFFDNSNPGGMGKKCCFDNVTLPPSDHSRAREKGELVRTFDYYFVYLLLLLKKFIY